MDRKLNDLNTARYHGKATGTTQLQLVFGGFIQDTSNKANTESWNGSSWTEVGDLNTG